MGNTDWSDLNRDGKRLEWIIKQMHTKYKREEKKVVPHEHLQFAYIDRIVKLTNLKHGIAITVLGVKEVLQQAKKQGIERPLEVPIVNA